MNDDEAKDMGQEPSKAKAVVSATPIGKIGKYIYLCMINEFKYMDMYEFKLMYRFS